MIGKKRPNISGRRRFLEVAAGALATTQLAAGANAGLAIDGFIELPQSEAPDSLSSLKQIDAGVLNVGYVEAGPIDGPVAILLHGWPYDIHSFGEVTPRLASAGYRVIVPYARGYDATFARSAAAFDNPDHVDIVIHNYRWRLGLAQGDPGLDELEAKLAASPQVSVPAITLEGDENGAPHPDPAAYAKKFSSKYLHRLVKGGIGHNLPQEAPEAFTQAVIDVIKG
jgi:pimeloyl-ACP methyl ester carboxylesterase